jgi:hypothetical protein
VVGLQLWHSGFWMCGWRSLILQGALLYSNADPHSHLHSQVIIIRNQEEILGEPEAKVLSRSCFVPEGRLYFGLLDEAALGDSSHPHLFSQGRAEWDSILRCTFGWTVDEFFHPKQADRLASFLSSGLSSLPHNILNYGPYESFVAVSP